LFKIKVSLLKEPSYPISSNPIFLKGIQGLPQGDALIGRKIFQIFKIWKISIPKFKSNFLGKEVAEKNYRDG